MFNCFNKKYNFFAVYLLIISLSFYSCTFINNGNCFIVSAATEKILNSDGDIGTLNVYVRSNNELKTLCDIIRLKNNSNFRVDLVLVNSDFSRTGDFFKDCKGIKSVSLPDSINIVEKNAFMGCENLSTVKFANGVNEIGDYSFYGCSALNNISIGNSCTSIGYGAFSHCSSLREFSIPASVKKIGMFAFSDCPVINFDVSGNNNWQRDDGASSSESTVLKHASTYKGEFELTR